LSKRHQQTEHIYRQINPESRRNKPESQQNNHESHPNHRISKTNKHLSSDSGFESKQVSTKKRYQSASLNKAEGLVYVNYSSQRKQIVEGMSIFQIFHLAQFTFYYIEHILTIQIIIQITVTFKSRDFFILA
jgi:hypothetical protein